MQISGPKVITRWAPPMGSPEQFFVVSPEIIDFSKKLFSMKIFSIKFVLKKVILNFDEGNPFF